MAAPKQYGTGALTVTAAQLETAARAYLGIDVGGAQVARLPLIVGDFTANGATGVDVVDTNVTATSMILIALKTPGGTVGAIPAVQTKTAGVGFNVAGTASDTSQYYYILIP